MSYARDGKRRRSALAVALAVTVASSLGACFASPEPTPRPPVGASPEPTPTAAAETPTTATERDPSVPLLVAAGDIACVPGAPVTPSKCQHGATADLVESLDPDLVMPLGDLQYERGEGANFDASYLRTWGRFLDRTRPVVGNHEYAGGKATGYYSALGPAGAGGVDGRGWYSFDVGAWHVVVLNSVCSVVGCDAGSDQLTWLRADLAASADHACTLAAFHHPRYSSGLHGSDKGLQPIWDVLAGAGVDVVLGGHDHHYERLATAEGIRQFVVGTGGRSLYPVFGRAEGSEIVDVRTFGVLALDLRTAGYDWRFVSTEGSTSGFTDEGSAGCR